MPDLQRRHRSAVLTVRTSQPQVSTVPTRAATIRPNRSAGAIPGEPARPGHPISVAHIATAPGAISKSATRAVCRFASVLSR
jgi:hypothetical protein